MESQIDEDEVAWVDVDWLARHYARVSDRKMRKQARDPKLRRSLVEIRENFEPFLVILELMQKVDKRLGRVLEESEDEFKS